MRESERERENCEIKQIHRHSIHIEPTLSIITKHNWQHNIWLVFSVVTAAAKSLRLFFCIFSLNSNSPHNLSRGTFSDPPCAAGPRPAPPDWPAGGRHRRQWRPLGSFSSLFSTSFIVKKGEPRAGGHDPQWPCCGDVRWKKNKKKRKNQRKKEKHQ